MKTSKLILLSLCWTSIMPAMEKRKLDMPDQAMKKLKQERSLYDVLRKNPITAQDAKKPSLLTHVPQEIAHEILNFRFNQILHEMNQAQDVQQVKTAFHAYRFLKNSCKLSAILAQGYKKVLKNITTQKLGQLKCSSTLYEAIFNAYCNDMQLCYILLYFTDNVNALNVLGNSALEYSSAYRGSIPITELLLKHGANINQGNINGETSLMLCSYHEWPEMFEFLIKSGANVNIRSSYDRTALMYAAQKVILKRLKHCYIIKQIQP